MSKFRKSARETPLPTPTPVANQAQAPGLVPMSEEEFNARRRKQAIKWGSMGAAAAIVLGLVLYWFSLPAEAANNYQDAQQRYQAGKYSDALVLASRAVQERGRRLQALKLRTAIYSGLHQTDDALKDAARVIELEPNNSENYRTLAQLHLDAGKLQDALNDYTKIIQMEQSATAYTGRGLCYVKLKQPERAIEDFTQAIDHAASVENYLQRGLARASVGQHEAAIEDFDHAIELNPKASTVYRARANSREHTGDSHGAKEDRATAYGMEKPVVRVEQVSVPKSEN